MPDFQSIRPQGLSDACLANQVLDIVDVRQPGEFASGHVRSARNLPLSSLSVDQLRNTRPADAVGPTYVICQAGSRSQRACVQLVNQGLTNVVNISGGTDAWWQAGLPMEQDRGTTAPGPRFTRIGIAAALLCVAFGIFVHPGLSYAAMGIWLTLLLLGRGACPFGSCSLPSKHRV